MAYIPGSSNVDDVTVLYDHYNDQELLQSQQLRDFKFTNQSEQRCYLCQQSSEQLMSETLSSTSNVLQDEQNMSMCIKCGLDLSQQELFNATVKYSEQVQKVKNQDNQVKDFQQNLRSDEQHFLQCLKKYQKIHSDVGKILEKFSYSSMNVRSLQAQFVQKSDEMYDVQMELENSVLQFQETKDNFQLQINDLKQREMELISTKEELKNVSEKFGIVPQYKNPIDVLSKQYRKTISENYFMDMLSRGGIENVSVCLESTEKFKYVDVYGDVLVKGLHISASSNQVQHLRLNFKTECSNIIFENCEFQGIGLILNGDTKLNNVSIKNVTILNAPAHGIRICFSNMCYIKNADVKIVAESNRGSGIILEKVDAFKIENSQVQGAFHGYFFIQSKGQMKSCLAQNCVKYGLVSQNLSCVKGEDIKFRNNLVGDTFGNFTNN